MVYIIKLEALFSSETTWPNGTKLGSKHLCKILYKASSFGSIWPTNMAAKITKNQVNISKHSENKL
jgi:hypothetical protein